MQIINFVLLSSFLLAWDIPESYKENNRSAFPSKGTFSSINNSNNHIKYIAEDSFFLYSLSIGQLMGKMNYNKIMQTNLMEEAFQEMREENIPRKFRNFIKDPYITGIDLDKPVYFYVSENNLHKPDNKEVVDMMINLYTDKQDLGFSSDDECIDVFKNNFQIKAWDLEVDCNSNYNYDINQYKHTLRKLTATSNKYMSEGKGNIISINRHGRMQGYGILREEDYFIHKFNYGLAIPIKDADLFENNIASMIDLIPDRDINIIDGTTNGFKYKLIQLPNFENNSNQDVIILAYNDEVLLVSFEYPEIPWGYSNFKSSINLIEEIENRINSPFNFIKDKEGIDKLNIYDSGLWVDGKLFKKAFNNFSKNSMEQLTLQGLKHDELKNIIDYLEYELELFQETPFGNTTIGIEAIKNTLSLSIKSYLNNSESNIISDYAKVLNKKIGKDILKALSLQKNSIGTAGFSVNIEEVLTQIKKMEKLSKTSDYSDLLINISKELAISVNDLENIFSGNFLLNIQDINIDDETIKGFLSFGINNPNNFIKGFNNLKEKPSNKKIYKNIPYVINPQDKLSVQVYLLINKDFGYIGSEEVIYSLLSEQNSQNSSISEIIKSKPEDLNFFMNINLDKIIDLIPADRRSEREIKSTIRSLKLDSFKIEFINNDNNDIEIIGTTNIKSGNLNILEFIIFNLIPIIEDEF